MEENIFWSAFCFEHYHPSKLHCTHKYFGRQTDEQARSIAKTIDDHFQTIEKVKPFIVYFHEEKYFGPNKDIRVLVPTQEIVTETFRSLREKLDAFRTDDWPEYLPHISTKDHYSIHLPFVSYVLMRDDKEYAVWHFEENK